jgi:glucose-6-phosphate isomerase
MNNIQMKFNHSLIEPTDLIPYNDTLKQEIQNLNTSLIKYYNDPHASINLLTDTEMLNQIKVLKKEKQAMNPRYIIIIGIGGSNLGTLAVQEAILGKLYNQKNPKIKIYYADTVDPDSLSDIKEIIESVLKNNDNILLIVVSKSGGTTETIVNYETLLSTLKKYKKNYQNYVVTITDRDSQLWKLAQIKGYSLLEIPSQVGGRFSIFSPVGLFPLAMIDIDIDQLIAGALTMRDRCLNLTIEENLAALSALHIFLHWKQGIRIHDLFLFSTDLESIGKWYRQLVGESIGKEYDINHHKIYAGITPTISIGSTDLHSMAQLYLAGPYDKFTTFVKLDESKTNPIIPTITETNNFIQGIEGKPVQYIMSAILTGIQKAFHNRKRPFMELILPDKTAASIGQFLQLKMMEIMYLGHLLNLNPFDQPTVEEYKIETKKILESTK